MGEQRRYARQLEQRTLLKQNRAIMAAGQPDTLRGWEIEADLLDVVVPDEPMPVLAHVVYGGDHLRVLGWALRWTPQWVEVNWAITADPDGARHQALLWRGAVKPRPPLQRAGFGGERNEHPAGGR